MDVDDLTPRKDAPLRALELEELDSLSLEELDERMARLAAEIERARAVKSGKEASRSVAEGVFNS